MSHEDRWCEVCGRRITWRRAWADDWEHVRYCSAGCRGRRQDRSALESAVLGLLGERAGGATACPSEVARRVGGDDDDAWRPLMEPVREAARRLAVAGRVEWLQGGRAVDPSTARGPVRLRMAPGG